MAEKLAPLAALTAGGMFLSNEVKRARAQMPHVEFEAPGTGPAVSIRRSVVVRPPTSAGTLVALAALAVGGYFAWAQMKKMRGAGSSSSVQETIELNVPLSTAYNQWTQFEEFP